MKIKQLFPVKQHTGDVGIEIEVEGFNLPKISNQVWRYTSDNSLKGGLEGIEYVMKAPISLSSLKEELVSFKEYFKNSSVDNSIYAGIHAHVNVQDITPKQLINYLVCFLIVEDLLVKWCGNTRVGNHFCLRSSDAEYFVYFLRKCIQEDSFDEVFEGSSTGGNFIRYSAANLKSLGKYGSIEFRCLNSTIEPDRIYQWSHTLISILNFAKQFSNPTEVISYFNSVGNGVFIKECLGEFHSTFLTGDWDSSLEDNIERAMDVAYSKKWVKSKNLNIFKPSKGIFNE